MPETNTNSDVKIFPKGTVIGVIGDAGKEAYEIDNNVNAGGEAIVYRARALKTGRIVAVKLHYKIDDELELKRFLRVKHIMQTVRGSNILPLEDAGIFMDNDEKYPYFVFPFISGGRTMETVIAQHRKQMSAGKEHFGTCVPINDLLYYAISAGSGLRDAHLRGVQHRDFKPANILIAGNGRNAVVRVMDFGIARFFDKEQDAKHQKLTVQGFFRGTPEYLSPEQARGGDPDVKGDIWAFGVVLYEMITGVSPFDFEDEHRMSVLSKVTFGDVKPTPIDTYCLGVDPLLVALTMRCMEHDPAKRPENMDEILEGLNRMELRLPHVFMSEAPPPILLIEEPITDPEAATIAAPSTPPKPISVDIPKLESTKITASLSLGASKVDSVSKETIKSKSNKPETNYLVYSLPLLLILTGMVGYYFRQDLSAYLPIKTAPSVSVSVATRAEQSVHGLLIEKRSKFSSADYETLEEIAISANPAKPAESGKTKRRPAKNRSYSQPIPGVDYVPGVMGQ